MLLMGKSSNSMVIFNSYVKLPEGNIGFAWFYRKIYDRIWMYMGYVMYDSHVLIVIMAYRGYIESLQHSSWDI